MHRLIPCLAALLWLAPVTAQDVELAEEIEIRRYTVEVIVFRYAQDVGTGSEVFLPDEPELLPGEASLESGDPGDPPAEPVEQIATEGEEPGLLPDTEFALLAEDDYELVESLEHLERLDAYEPLMHFGWTQATWPREQTEAIPLARFAEPPEGLEGSLTLYLSRYLHLVVDVQLMAPENVDEEYSDDGLFGEQAPSTWYRISEDRILKNGELRYYDHPKFGVLAKVTRVEEEEEELPEDGELLGYPVE